MSAPRSPSGIKVKPFAYEGFSGIDRSRDIRAMDTGENQALFDLTNGFCDFRGAIVMNPGLTQVPESVGTTAIEHVAFYGRGYVVWAERKAAYISLGSDRGHTFENAYLSDSVISSAVFNKKNIFFSKNQGMKSYDGRIFSEVVPASNPQPAFGVAIQRRLAIAGMAKRRTVVDLSRVDEEGIFSEDEELNAPQVTKAAYIDVANLIGTSDEITGLGVFESNRLVVFTNDQALVYTIHPDATKWALDDKAMIRIGCISHNTVVSVGSDLLFCSRSGIHSIRRSEANGVTIFSLPLSSKVEEMYRALVRQVVKKEKISAFYDPDMGQYHVFFPVQDDLAHRLTFSVNPIPGQESKWSRADDLQSRCGAALAGSVVFGTNGGVWEQSFKEDLDAEHYPTMVVTTPILWQGALNDYKQGHSFVLQASGKGRVVIEAMTEEGKTIASWVFELEDDSVDDEFFDAPLIQQYERKFERRWKGLQFRFTLTGKGLVKIIGFAVIVRTSR